jgi:hypothetical protein
MGQQNQDDTAGDVEKHGPSKLVVFGQTVWHCGHRVSVCSVCSVRRYLLGGNMTFCQKHAADKHETTI